MNLHPDPSTQFSPPDNSEITIFLSCWQVAYAWAISLGGEDGAVLLKKLGLLDPAIDYAMESGAFAQAFELTKAGNKLKLPEVHLKWV